MSTVLEPRPAAPGARPLPLASSGGHTTLPLAARYLAASGCFLLAGAAGLIWIAPSLAGGQFLAPHVAAVTHLFTLGWLTLTIFGAMAQITPMALGAPLRAVRLGHATFWILAPSIALFAYGVGASSTPITGLGVIGVAAGIALNVGNFAVSLARARTRDVSWASLMIGLAFLSSTLVLGLALAHNLHSGFIAAARVRVLAAHLHVAIVGWVLIVLVGVSNRMLPMFLMSRGVDARWSRRSVALLAVGVPVLAVALGTGMHRVAWLGTALLEGGLAAFLCQARAFHRAGTRRRLDPGMRFAALGVGFLTVAAMLGPLVLVRGLASPRLATAYVAAGLVGGATLYVVGHYYKVASMLAWTLRFAGRAGRGPIRTVGALYSEQLAMAQLALMGTGVTVLVVGILTGTTSGTAVGAGLFFAGALVQSYQLVRMAWAAPAAPTVERHPT
jgi:hypothetical protein